MVVARVVLLCFLADCAEATLASQSRDEFAKAAGCTVDVTVAQTTTPPHELLARGATNDQRAYVDANYVVMDVRGCGQRHLYACTRDWTYGCFRRGGSVSVVQESPGTSFPPTLVDQTPLPLPPLPPQGD